MVKYSKDDRYSKESISTHDKLVTKATSCSELKNVVEQAKTFGVIGIDEGQFVSLCVCVLCVCVCVCVYV